MREVIAQIAAAFEVPGTFVGAEPVGSGLIHETWQCEFSAPDGRRRFILQRMNDRVFTHPDWAIENVEQVTLHLQERLRREGAVDPAAVSPVLVQARGGGKKYRDDRYGMWRMFHFVEDSAVYDLVHGPAHAREIGRALGRFHTLVADLEPSLLHDTLPGLHDTPQHLQALEAAVRQNAAGRSGAVGPELAFVRARADYAPLLMEALRQGRVPERVVHNDPKVNNVLVHVRSGKAICMIDLDTVKPGASAFDLGDCVRSAANRAGEDADPPTAASFDRDCYEAIREGYLAETADLLTQAERDLLPVGVKVITFELGIRFLADHLRGDTYFRIGYPGHNLHRARVQFHLLAEMERAGL